MKPERNIPRQSKKDLMAWLVSMMLTPISLSGIGFGGARELSFRGGSCSPENITSPMPTRRYLARLRYSAQHAGRGQS